MRFILALLFSLTASASVNEVDRAQVFANNILYNAGFENGKYYWTESGGTFAIATSGSNKLIGGTSATWDSSASAQYLYGSAVTIPNGLYGRNGTVSCVFMTPSGTATHTISAYDGSNILSSSTIVSSTSPVRTSANFVFPSSGTIQLRVYSVASNEPSITIDSCYMGPSDGINMQNVAQAQYIGGAYYATTAACAWSRSNAALGAFTSDTDCPAPTVVSNPGPGTISTTDANLPQFTVTNLPPGTYRVEMKVATDEASTANCALAINDGTTTGTNSGFNSSTSTTQNSNVTGVFTYTSSGDRTFALYGACSAGTALTISNSTSLYTTTFDIFRYPTTNEQAYRPDMVANSWSGYHDSTCSWSRSNAAYGDPTADASCALTERTNTNFGTVSTSGSVLPAITFTPKVAGKYWVCAIVEGQVNNVNGSFRLWDGTTTISERAFSYSSASYTQVPLCGIYSAASTSSVTLSIQVKSAAAGLVTIATAIASSAIEWSVVQVNQSVPAPLLVNSVVSPSSGVVKVASAYITNSGTPTVSRQDGSWISSLTDNGIGDTTINISAGTFSATPNCFCMTSSSTAANAGCKHDDTTAASSTALRIETTATTTAAQADMNFYVICVGAP